MKKSYMVAVKVKIEPIVYIEVIASSEKEAVAEVEKNRTLLTIAHKEDFQAEALQCLEFVPSQDIKIKGCGQSSQYHDKEECEICSSIS